MRAKYIEMNGRALMSMLEPDEVSPEELRRAGLTDTCLVRINQQGDIEVRRHDRWDVIGGLTGSFGPRSEGASGRQTPPCPPGFGVRPVEGW